MAEEPRSEEVAGAVATLLICEVLSGVLFQTCWLWFIVPLGVPVISYWHALALSAFIHAYTAYASGADAAEPLRAYLLRAPSQHVGRLGALAVFAIVCHYLMES